MVHYVPIGIVEVSVGTAREVVTIVGIIAEGIFLWIFKLFVEKKLIYCNDLFIIGVFFLRQEKGEWMLVSETEHFGILDLKKLRSEMS